MSNYANPREPQEMNGRQLPADHRHMNDYPHSDRPIPPHVRASKIRLIFNENTLAKITRIYENVEYLESIIEACPPEIKITLAMLLDIQVDLKDYPQETYPRIRFLTPFMNGKNSELIEQAIDCEQKETILQIYNACPPEQALLALAVAVLKKHVTGMEILCQEGNSQ